MNLLVRASAILITVLAAGAASPFGAPPPVSAAVPAEVRCGGHRIVTDRVSRTTTPAGPTRLRVIRGGRALYTFGGAPDAGVAIVGVDCQDVTGDRVPEVVFEIYSGGAHCCWTLFILSVGHAIRPLLKYEAGNDGGMEVRDVNGDGRPELLLGDDTFAYFDDLCFACSPIGLPLVACFKGGRFEDCTRTAPALLRDKAAFWTRELRDLSAKVKSDPDLLIYLRGAALGLYATHVLLGQEAAGWQAVRAHAPDPRVAAWLARHRAAVQKWAKERGKRLASR